MRLLGILYVWEFLNREFEFGNSLNAAQRADDDGEITPFFNAIYCCCNYCSKLEHTSDDGNLFEDFFQFCQDRK